MADWPSSLPLPSKEGYSLEPIDQTVGTDMEVGLPRTRRRTAARQDLYSLRLTFTSAAQMATFRDFFDNIINGGTSFFTIELDGGLVSARFKGGWKADLAGKDTWIVSATLEVRDV